MQTINQLIDSSLPLRIERKYWFALENESKFLAKLSASPFFQPYPKRQVNSLYLDNSTLDSYHQSVNGIYNRHKIRLRWYGKLFQNKTTAQLELKYKQGQLGGKEIFPLEKISFEKNTSKKSVKKQMIKQLPENIKKLTELLQPTITTAYQRQYWQHRFYPIRLTIDTQLETANHLGKLTLDKPLPPQHQLQIIELKYLPEDNLEKIATQIGQFLPLQLNQFSKYSWGIEQ